MLSAACYNLIVAALFLNRFSLRKNFFSQDLDAPLSTHLLLSVLRCRTVDLKTQLLISEKKCFQILGIFFCLN